MILFSQVSNMTRLRELTITGNEIRQLPAELGCVTTLEKVHVDRVNNHLRRSMLALVTLLICTPFRLDCLSD
jgi:Leucine-rich repeat (LRR) protein